MPPLRTSPDSITAIHREAVARPLPEIARYLQENLGQHVTAYLAGLNDPKMVGRWIQERSAPRELSEFRLREGYLAARLLVAAYGDQTARAWFFGTNSFLGKAPAAVLRTAETPEETHEVITAAESFVAEELAAAEGAPRDPGSQPPRREERLEKTQGRSCVVLLSGGLDSATTLAIANAEGYRSHALSFRYGQRHAVEIQAARRVAAHLGVVEHVVLDIDLRRFGASALTADIDVPKARKLTEISEGIPTTYVPARNTIFLSFALAWAEVLGCEDIFVGVNALDYSGYPDCRPKYVAAFKTMANLATKAGVEGAQALEIHAPLMQLAKSDIIRRGIELGVDYALTLSCYDPSNSGEACGACDACLLRCKGFQENGLADPAPYREGRARVAG